MNQPDEQKPLGSNEPKGLPEPEQEPDAGLPDVPAAVIEVIDSLIQRQIAVELRQISLEKVVVEQQGAIRKLLGLAATQANNIETIAKHLNGDGPTKVTIN